MHKGAKEPDVDLEGTIKTKDFLSDKRAPKEEKRICEIELFLFDVSQIVACFCDK